MKYIAAIAVATLMLAGCKKENESTPAAAATQPEAPEEVITVAESAAAPADARLVELSVSPDSPQALAIFGGQSVEGVLKDLEPNQIAALGVRIGNYVNKSDGSLTLDACVDTACQTATVPLMGSQDNKYLVFTFPQPLVIASGQQLTYKLTRSQSGNGVAIWTYAPLTASTTLKDAKGIDTGRTPQFALYVK